VNAVKPVIEVGDVVHVAADGLRAEWAASTVVAVSGSLAAVEGQHEPATIGNLNGTEPRRFREVYPVASLVIYRKASTR
jgi:hypothetical protein